MSIRLRLFLILALATGLVWLAAAVWIERSTRSEVERVLDARLAEAATMVSSLISDRRIAVAEASGAIALPAGSYARQLSCQIWSLQGRLVGRSLGAPDTRLAAAGGFSTRTIEGETWRVFTVDNTTLGVQVMVGDRITVRDRLVRDVIGGLLLPAAVIFPALAVLIWVGVAGGLAPLARLESDLRIRQPSDLGPLAEGPAPREIGAVRQALNGLFARLQAVRSAEREFTAFAAHELKTPLAGLRTHAQIAGRAEDPLVRNRALAAIAASVDRTDRMVRQLLELASVEREAETSPGAEPALLAEGVVADLAPLAEAREVRIDTRIAATPPLSGNGFLFHAALRNLIENAILASPRGGRVRLSLGCDGDRMLAVVEDEGPGIAAAERDLVTRRFFRGAAAQGEGSGLGLAIVASAVQRLGGTLTLCPSTGAGQRVELRLPCEDTGHRA